ELYQRTAARWIIPQVGRIELGTLPLSALTVSLVREWHTELVAATHAAATATTGQGRRTHPARAWARAQGFEVADTGKLPAAVVDAWTAAGAPAAESVTGPVDPEHAATAGRTAAAQAYRLLRTMLAQAVRDGLIPTNPAQVKGAATAPHPERIPLTAPEVTALAEAVAPRFRAAVLVAAWSGLRPGELFALQRADVDPEAGTVTVRRTLVQVTGQPVSYGPPKTSAGRRTVALPGSVTAALAAHLETYTGPDPAALVFTTATGQPVTSTRRTRALAPARESIGRPDISWHHLRHTGATLAAITGATQAELQRRIGHASPRAAALYQHASTTRDHWIATQLDTLAGTPTPPPPPTEPGPAPLTPDTPTPTPVTHRPRP
ncbi:site-specific integrase, partial [Citricoccus sp. NPDC055426]|uniref:tyrosine-type recombinase/integrase n=1 Tax=Citricoccus sp. NPDC055426 TaxID=3155536 RepID=UPI00343F1DED